MRVTVTGGGGFVGRHLVRRLSAEGCEVTVIDDFSSAPFSKCHSRPGLTIVRGCVTDAAAMRKALAGAERVFHLAAVVGQLKVSRMPAWSLRVSTESMRLINDFAPEALLLLASSSAVYGLGSAVPCEEDLHAGEAAARDYDGTDLGYAVGKWRSEQLARNRMPGTTIIVRPFNIIGPGQVGSYGMVVPRFVQNALKGEPMIIYGTGTQRRSFGGVDAFIGHLLRLVDHCQHGRGSGLPFNIGNRVETSINALADAVDLTLGTRTPRLHVSYESVYPGKRDVQIRKPDLGRIEAVIGPLMWPPLGEVINQVASAMRESRRPMLAPLNYAR